MILRSWSLLLVVALSTSQVTQGLPITLTVSPNNVLTGASICQNTQVVFTCIADQVAVVTWRKNNDINVIRSFTLREMPVIQETVGALTVILNASVTLSGGATRNATSTLIANSLSALQSGDIIMCEDDVGESITLNFTSIGIPPVPENFKNSLQRSATFDLIWNEQFNSRYNIEMYNLAVSGHPSISCPATCLPNGPCVCSGLFAGRDVTSDINITAVNCGNQEGPPVIISITPRVPEMPSSCQILPIYNSTGQLIDLDISWNNVSNPANFSSTLRQDVLNYSLSVNSNTTDIPVETACPVGRNTSKCSVSFYSNYNQPSNSSAFLSDVSVTAENNIGKGPSQTCNVPFNGSVSPTNTVFSVSVTDGIVECNQLTQNMGMFTCEFCYNLGTCEQFTECVNGITKELTNMRGGGMYCYRATAYFNGTAIAIITDSFLFRSAVTEFSTSLLGSSISFLILAFATLVIAVIVVSVLYYLARKLNYFSESKYYIICFVLFAIAAVTVVLSLILLIVYGSNPNGTPERNSVAASLAFSLLSFGLSIIATLLFVIVKLKFDSFDSDEHREAKQRGDINNKELSAM